jgi:hypothetical protein
MGEVENCLDKGAAVRKTGWKLKRVIGALAVDVMRVRRMGGARAGRWIILRRARRASGENNWDILVLCWWNRSRLKFAIELICCMAEST